MTVINTALVPKYMTGAFTFKVNTNKNTMPSHTSPPPLYIYLVNMNSADAT